MYKRLLGETAIYGLGAILPKLINFALTRLYTTEIVDADFSKFSQLYALVSFVNIILTFGFETAYFRFSSDKNLSGKVFHLSFWFVFVNSLLFLISVYLFKSPIAQFFGYEDHPEYLIWFAWIAFFDAICMVPFAFLRFTNKPIRYSAIKIFQGVFQTLLVIFFFYGMSEATLVQFGLTEKVSYPFFANLIAAFSGILLLFPILSKVRFYYDKELLKKMVRYAYPIMLAGLAFTINENFDKIIQPFLISKADAGAYGGVYKLAVFMTLFVTAYRLGIEPFFFKKMQDSDAKETYADVMLYFVAFCGAAIVFLLGNLNWLKDLLIGDPSYLVAMDIVPIVIIANLFYGIYYNLSTWYKVTDKTYVGTIISLIGGGITILINVVFIPIVGFMASAWATLIAYGSMMLISYLWGQKSYPIPYKFRKITLYVVLSIGFGIISYYLADGNIIIGNLLAIIYVAFIIYVEKKSLELVKNKK